MSAIFDFAAPPDAAPQGAPYEGQRRRLVLMERLTAARHGVPIARAREMVGRDVKLTAEQIVNIRKRKRKGLYADIRDRIDARFLALARRVVHDLTLEMAAVAARPGGLDPGALDQAMATRDALVAMIEETRAGAARRRAPPREAEATWQDGETRS